MSQAGQGASAPVTTSPTRGLWWIAAAIVALAAIAVVVVLTLGNRQARTFDAGTPERTLQDYLRAFDAGDYTTAYGYFSSTAKSEASESEYLTGVPMYGPGYDPSSQRVVFEGRTGSGDRVILQLTVEELSGGVGQVYRSSRTIPMVRESGAWYIDQLLIRLDPGPWPFYKAV